MLPLAVTGYEISLAIHISAATLGLGAVFAEALFFSVALSAGPRYLPLVHRLQKAINTYLANPALLIILVTGLYQVSDGDWSLGDVWLSATFAIVIALGALLGAYLIPTDRKLGALVEAELAAAGDGEVRLSEEYLRRAKAERVAAVIAGALVVAAIFLMVIKPGA